MIQIAATKTALATAYKNRATSGAPYIGLHTGSPGTAGTSNEATGSPYVRKQITWVDGSAGTLSATSVTVPVPAGTYKFASLWTAASGGTCIDWVAITETTLGAAGEISLTPTFTVN